MEKTKKCAYWMAVVMAFALVMGVCALTPTQAHATDLTAGKLSLTTQASTAKTVTTAGKAKNPYPDVTVKTVGKYAYNAIKFVKAHGGYKGVVSGTKYVKQKNGLYKKVTGKFYPKKTVTKREFVYVLANLYGNKKVSVSTDDMKNANKPATEKWARAKMVATAKKLGYPIKWGGGKSTKLTRASAANYLYVFGNFNKKLTPTA